MPFLGEMLQKDVHVGSRTTRAWCVFSTRFSGQALPGVQPETHTGGCFWMELGGGATLHMQLRHEYIEMPR
jgi:hypothetical protein